MKDLAVGTGNNWKLWPPHFFFVAIHVLSPPWRFRRDIGHKSKSFVDKNAARISNAFVQMTDNLKECTDNFRFRTSWTSTLIPRYCRTPWGLLATRRSTQF